MGLSGVDGPIFMICAGLLLFVKVFLAFVDDEAFVVLAHLLAHHVVDGGVDAVHGGGSGLTLAAEFDGVDAGAVQYLLQAFHTVQFAEACLYPVVRRQFIDIGCPLVVVAGLLHDVYDLSRGQLGIGLHPQGYDA